VAHAQHIARLHLVAGPPPGPLEERLPLGQQMLARPTTEARADTQPLVDAAGGEIGAVVARLAQPELEAAHGPAATKADGGGADGPVERLLAGMRGEEPTARLGLREQRRPAQHHGLARPQAGKPRPEPERTGGHRHQRQPSESRARHDHGTRERPACATRSGSDSMSAARSAMVHRSAAALAV